MNLKNSKKHSQATACGKTARFILRAGRAAVFFSVALLLSSGAGKFAAAQDIFGRIAGTVTDSSGATVANAKITIVNEATQISRNTTADKNGFFAADELPAGTYSVTAEQTGFKTTTETGNALSAGGRLTVDLRLQVGAVTEVVTVTAVGDTVNTTSGEVSTTITQQQVLTIALNQRHYESLVGLVPGAALQGSGTNPAALTANYNNSVADINGQRLDGQNWSVDGGFNLDSGSNNSVFNQVGVDFIQEVDVQSSNYDAEFGRSASATINVVTKSGGEQYHGGGFEFVQNNDFNAENQGTKLTNPTAKGYAAVPPFHFNDFGWDLGGPIPLIQRKGKLFFFAGQEWKKFRGVYPGLTAASVQETLPTAAEVAGNFTDVLPPGPGKPGITLLQPAIIPASCGGVFFTAPNVINPACITGDGAAIAALYTAAAKLSVGGGLPTSIASGNTSFNLANPLNLREDIIRVDEHASEKHSFYFRYIHDNVDIYNPYSTFGAAGALPVDPDLRNRPGYNTQFGWVYSIRPTLINEFKFNADWHKQTTPVQGTAYLKSTYGFKFIPPLGSPAQFPDGLPAISFTGVAGVATSGPAGVNGPAPNFLESPTADINPADNVVWQKDNHTIKFGGEYARNRKRQNSRTNYDGAINFSTAAGTNGSNSTGDPFADALLGNFNSLNQSSAVTVGEFRFNDVELYLQDTWKVTRKLSLVLGMRYTHSTPTYAEGNNITNFDPYTFNPALDPTFTGGLASSKINPASPGLCSGPLLNVVGTPVLTIECNGLQRPGQVPSDQKIRVPVTSTDPTLLAAISANAARGFYNTENLPAPRVGFAYTPFSDNKTVLRGGFGIFYDHPEGNVLGNGINSQGYPPWAQAASISGINASLSQFDSAPGAGTVAAPTTISGIAGVDPHLVVARTYQYSLGVQRELPLGILVQASYVGNVGRHLLRTPSINNATWTAQGFIPSSPNPNNLACPAGINATAFQCSGAGFAPSGLAQDQIRPYLGYSALNLALSDVNSNYNALQLSLTKRAGILTATAAYTYSKTMGFDGGAGDAYNENPEPECPFTCLVSTAANPVMVNGSATTKGVVGGTQTGGVVETWKQFDYGKVSFDATHILSATFTIESPWGKNMAGFEGAVVKGWSLSALMHYQSGAPLTATATQGVGLSGMNVGRRADFAAGQSVAFSGTCANPKAICWVNPAAFTLEPFLGAGDTSIGNIIGPNYYQWDLSLRKAFRLPFREGMRLQFQADAFNAFNRANWNNPTVNNVTTASFGQITGSLPARVLQLGGKFTF
jgi:hypothetical protein